jgi:hypothetical protein
LRPNLVGTEGIEPNCRHLAYYGKRFTVSRKEQPPDISTLSAMLLDTVAG